MSNLVDTNRLQFQKIFEAHQQKASLSYTDALKICSTLNLFPDLLSSQEIRKIFLTLSFSNNGSERMTFLQFESFLKIIAKQAFRHQKKNSNDYETLISYIKDKSFQRYGTNLDLATKGRSLTKTIRNNSKKNMSTPKNIQKSFFKPSSQTDMTKTVTKLTKKSTIKLSTQKMKGFMSLLSTGVLKKEKSSALTERRDGHNSGCSTSPSPCKPNILHKIGKLVADFKNSYKTVTTNKYLASKKIKNILDIESQKRKNFLLLKMAFTIWKIDV